MKTTIASLEHTISMMQETITVCTSSKSKKVVEASLLESISSINSTISHLKESEKRKFIAVRKSLASVSNVMTGMCEGLADSSFSREDFRAATSVLRKKFFPAVRQSLIAEVEAASEEEPVKSTSVSREIRTKIKITISKSAEMAEAVRVASQSQSAGSEVNGDVSESPLEAMGRVARAALPVRIQGGFKMVRVPIVPIFPNPAMAKSETLNRLGLKFVMFEGICILQDQILLNVSKKRTGGSKEDPLALAHSVVDLLNDRGSVKYEIVSDTPNANPRNTDLLMFWILPRQRMSGLMKILGASKSPAVVKWGLPLPSHRAESERSKLERISKDQGEKERIRQEMLEQQAIEREQREAKRLAEREKRKADRKASDSQRVENKSPVRVAARPVVKVKTASQEKLQELVRRNHDRSGSVRLKG